MNTSILLTSTVIISLSLIIYLKRKPLYKRDNLRLNLLKGRRLWEKTHTFSDGINFEKVQKRKVKLSIIK